MFVEQPLATPGMHNIKMQYIVAKFESEVQCSAVVNEGVEMVAVFMVSLDRE